MEFLGRLSLDSSGQTVPLQGLTVEERCIQLWEVGLRGSCFLCLFILWSAFLLSSSICFLLGTVLFNELRACRLHPKSRDGNLDRDTGSSTFKGLREPFATVGAWALVTVAFSWAIYPVFLMPFFPLLICSKYSNLSLGGLAFGIKFWYSGTEKFTVHEITFGHDSRPRIAC